MVASHRIHPSNRGVGISGGRNLAEFPSGELTAAVARNLSTALIVAVFVFGALVVVRGVQDTSGVDGRSVGTDVAFVGSGLSDSPAGEVIVVASGDSLWSIAVDRFPERDPREVVELLMEVNGGSVIHAGQRLAVPPELDIDQPAVDRP